LEDEKMRCPVCKTENCYVGFFGPDCVNPGCKNWKNGSVSGKRPDPNDDLDFRGFIVLREGRDLPSEEYVFATRADAERWRELNGIFDAKIMVVGSTKPFRWQPSRGTVRGIILADRLFTVYPSDHVPNSNDVGAICKINPKKNEEEDSEP
jgi:hypothetical protein